MPANIRIRETDAPQTLRSANQSRMISSPNFVRGHFDVRSPPNFWLLALFALVVGIAVPVLPALAAGPAIDSIVV